MAAFPGTADISAAAAVAVRQCNVSFESLSADEQLMELVRAEYELFRLVERVMCRNEVQRLFTSIDDFLETALTILNRRKVRAGRALENHFESLLSEADLRFEVRPQIDGRPDVILPSREAYEDSALPSENLTAIGLKTTCKDRWRQILKEARRAGRRFLVTLQQGITTAQLDEMTNSDITVVVPRPLHRFFARSDRGRLMQSGFFRSPAVLVLIPEVPRQKVGHRQCQRPSQFGDLRCVDAAGIGDDQLPTDQLVTQQQIHAGRHGLEPPQLLGAVEHVGFVEPIEDLGVREFRVRGPPSRRHKPSQTVPPAVRRQGTARRCRTGHG